MPTTFHALWKDLDSTSKSELSACLDATKDYLSQIAHGRKPSLLLARCIALCVLDNDGQLVRQVDRKVGELLPGIRVPHCPSRSLCKDDSNPTAAKTR